MGRCWGGRHATWAWHRKLLKLHKTNCWALAFPPYRKTISTVIKGELNHLISSKVTEQPPLSPPFPSSFSPSILFLTIPLSRPARWRPPMKCHQISGGVRGHWTKNALLNTLVWQSERKGCVFCFARIDGWTVVHGKRWETCVTVLQQITLFKVHPYSSTDVSMTAF